MIASIACNHLRCVAMARKAGLLPSECAPAQNHIDTIMPALDSEQIWAEKGLYSRY